MDSCWAPVTKCAGYLRLPSFPWPWNVANISNSNNDINDINDRFFLSENTDREVMPIVIDSTNDTNNEAAITMQ